MYIHSFIRTDCFLGGFHHIHLPARTHARSTAPQASAPALGALRALRRARARLALIAPLVRLIMLRPAIAVPLPDGVVRPLAAHRAVLLHPRRLLPAALPSPCALSSRRPCAFFTPASTPVALQGPDGGSCGFCTFSDDGSTRWILESAAGTSRPPWCSCPSCASCSALWARRRRRRGGAGARRPADGGPAKTVRGSVKTLGLNVGRRV
ncbi:hypothetical protein B0H17DRAFT_1076451 [Mycena rosella]|uniref:Uncharacterized protein n=1 Tax=Mycena rosella TaxID=1033263 RepID=A0AAD7D6T1_MYCRO|nr:hypothetical protein B0H17DRAFT_1076451 [Mycena rosella]